jgi:beta-glucanase (GH16 family)
LLNLTGYKLTFSDEFNSRSISWTGDGTKWQTARDEWRMADGKSDIGFGSSSFVDPSSGYDPFKVGGGALTITAQPDKTPYGWKGSWESGLITTQGNFSQKYGYFEMRADMSNSPGAWDAFWLMPDRKSDPDGDGDWTELDIVEHYGIYNQGTYRWIHTNDKEKHPNPNETLQVFSNNPEQTSGYHTYGVNWTPTSLDFYFDGKFMGSRPTPSDFHDPMYIIANLAVQGNDLPAGANSPLDPMKIDYIRAFSNDPNAVAVKQDTISAPDAKDPGLYGATTASGPSTPSVPSTPAPSAPVPSVPSTPSAPPASPTALAQGSLKVKVSGDHYNGAPVAEISVDGKVVGTYNVTADHSKGEWQDIIVKGGWADGTDHDVAVKFLNDAYGGTAATDRNLWFKSAELNGVVVGEKEQWLNSSGASTTFRIDDTPVLASAANTWDFIL